MTLEEIFKTNPALMEAPEVKLLIDQAQTQYHKARDKWQATVSRENRAMLEAFDSELFIIGGRSCEETLLKIISILE